LAGELQRREARKEYYIEREVLRIFRCICEATSAFHSVQPDPLVHRDLKTGNILLDCNFNPVIMDLGKNRGFRLLHMSKLFCWTGVLLISDSV
jgi:serine/threonine protein kinase